MSKVLFVNPNIRVIDREKDHYSAMEHLGLGMLSAVLKRQGHEVGILDCYALNLDVNTAYARIAAFQPTFLGLTANYLNIEDATAIAERAAMDIPSLYVFVGGEHCTYSTDQLLERHSWINAVVRGEGEASVVELVAKAPNLEGVAGVHYRHPDTGTIVRNTERPGIANLDLLPFADRSTLDYCKQHRMTTAIGMLAQRGCNFRCGFCNANTFLRMGGGSPIRRRSPRNVADELEWLHAEYFQFGNIEKVYFYDANFIDGSRRSKDWAMALAKEIVARDIAMPLEVYMRGDSLNADDDALVMALKQAGLEAVFIGIESFSASDLEFYGKDVTPARMSETLDLLARHRVLGPTQGVIMFNPYSTDTSLTETAQFLKTYGYASFWNLTQKLQLFPGVSLVEKLERQGFLRGHGSTNKVYSYGFKDPIIGALSDYLLELNHSPAVIRDNALPRHVSTELFRILNNIEAAGLLSFEVELIIATVRHRLAESNALNVAFFEDMVHLFRKESNRSEVEARTSAYLKHISNCLDEIEASFSAALTSIHAYVSTAIKAEDERFAVGS